MKVHRQGFSTQVHTDRHADLNREHANLKNPADKYVFYL